MIWSIYGRAEVDVFASETSTHCPLWYSLMRGTSPLGQDALAHAWPTRLLYAFSPIPLIRVTLERVRQKGHRLLLVALNWPGWPWFPVLLKLLQGEPWRLPRRPDLLSQVGGTHMASESGSPSALGLAIWSQDPLLVSCDQSVIHTVLSSWAPSTRSLYANRWKLFSQWCQTQGEVPENCSVAIIHWHSQSLLDAGRCASTLKVHFGRTCQSEQPDSGVTLSG